MEKIAEPMWTAHVFGFDLGPGNHRFKFFFRVQVKEWDQCQAMEHLELYVRLDLWAKCRQRLLDAKKFQVEKESQCRESNHGIGKIIRF